MLARIQAASISQVGTEGYAPMIVALLVLIILILLFGAGVVKGWIANAATMGCGFIAICVALIWVSSFFGKDGFFYLMLVIGGIALVLAIFAAIFNDQAPKSPPLIPRAPASPNRPRSVIKPTPPPEPPAVERVWGWYAHDIALRFSPEAREKARKLYDDGDAHSLDRFCREEVSRLK